MLRVYSRAFFLTACTFISMASAHAQISDPANDFIPTYQGLHGGDLDVVSANGILNGNNFVFSATMNAPLFTTPNASNSNALYVWGINRGRNSQGFPVIAPGVLFDTVVVVTLSPGGGVAGRTGANNLSVNVSGNSFSVTVPTAFLPSQGFAFADYTWNLWPRGTVNAAGAPITGDVQIADFAPDNSNVRVIAVPEPSSIALLTASVLTGTGFLTRRRRRRS